MLTMSYGFLVVPLLAAILGITRIAVTVHAISRAAAGRSSRTSPSFDPLEGRHTVSLAGFGGPTISINGMQDPTPVISIYDDWSAA
jgi:hypothetical protein